MSNCCMRRHAKLNMDTAVRFRAIARKGGGVLNVPVKRGLMLLKKEEGRMSPSLAHVKFMSNASFWHSARSSHPFHLLLYSRKENSSRYVFFITGLYTNFRSRSVFDCSKIIESNR